MSLLDFDDDPSLQPTQNVSFNGHSTSIDDPFGFDVFGSSGTKTTSVTETAVYSGNSSDKFFDDFDPLAAFNDAPPSHQTTTRVVTTTTKTTSSDRGANGNDFDPFGDLAATNGSTGGRGGVIAFETSSAADPFARNGSESSDRRDSEDQTADDDWNKMAAGVGSSFKAADAENASEYKQDRPDPWKQEELNDEDVHSDSGDNHFHANESQNISGTPEKQRNYHEEAEVEEDSTYRNPYLDDFRDPGSRGRISLEEISQRSYVDSGPVSSKSHNQYHREERTTEKAPPPTVYVLGAAMDNICKLCSKRVYEMEKITADNQVYHKTCFRCNHCNRVLSLGNFSANEGRLYCKPHFIEIFKTKGNYKDSFALAEEHKNRDARGDIFSQDEEEAGARSSLSETGVPRNRKSSLGYQDVDEEDGDPAHRGDVLRETNEKEEIPVVQIKSVRSMFEKLSQDVATVPQPKLQKATSAPKQNDYRKKKKVPTATLR